MKQHTLYHHSTGRSVATPSLWRFIAMVYLLFVSRFVSLYERDAANPSLRKSSLRASSGPVWKSWLAALCVALLAFAMLEQASPAHAADSCNNSALSLTNGDSAAIIVAVGGAQDDPSAPDQQQQRHHCCSAHTSNAPLAQASAPTQLTRLAAPARVNDVDLDNTPTGLERPPKPPVIV